MRREYFVDTWFFIAYVDPRDSHHRRARQLGSLIAPSRLLTHEAVLTEVLAYFSDSPAAARVAAVRVVRNAFESMEVAHVATELFDAGLTLYESRPDKEYSHVDCISMVLMRRRGIALVLTNDHHFRQEGFDVVSE